MQVAGRLRCSSGWRNAFVRREVAFGRRRDSILAASQAADRALVCRRHGDRHFAAPPALRAALAASVEAAVSLEAARVMSVSR
jgi:hypothetical protein